MLLTMALSKPLPQMNAELQGVVLQTVRGYAGRLGLETQQCGGDAVRAFQVLDDDPSSAVTDADKQAMTVDAHGHDIMLSQRQAVYRNWEIQMFREVLLYCVPWITKRQVNGLCNVEVAKQVVEYAWDLRICEHNARFDRVPCMSKRVVWENLAKQYITKGRRLDHLLHCFSQDYVNWSVHGHYDLHVIVGASGAKSQVAVTHKLLNRTRYLPEELLRADDFRGCETRSNYSQASAFIWVASGESYPISSLFPYVVNKLAKEASDPATPTASCYPGGPLKRLRSSECLSSSWASSSVGRQYVLPPLDQVLQLDAQTVLQQQSVVECDGESSPSLATE